MNTTRQGGKQAEQRRPNMNRYYSGGQSSTGKSSSPFRPKPARPARKKFVVRLTDFIIIVILITAIGYDLLVQPTPKVQVNSFAYHSRQDYLSAATRSISGVMDKTKITFNERAVTESLKAQFPEISTASVELPLIGRQARVNLEIAAPSYFINSGGRTYVVAADGIAVAQASQLPQVKNLTAINDQSSFKITVGQPALAASAINFLNTIVAQCQRAGVPISSLTLPPVAQELDLRTKDQSYFVKFYLAGNALNQVGQLIAARHQFSKDHNQPERYLDVRVDGKVFYK